MSCTFRITRFFKIVPYFLLWQVHLFAQCPPAGGVTLINQSQVNNFAVLYPGCTTIAGDLNIGVSGSPSDITDLTPLSSLTTITRGLYLVDDDVLTTDEWYDIYALNAWLENDLIIVSNLALHNKYLPLQLNYNKDFKQLVIKGDYVLSRILFQ